MRGRRTHTISGAIDMRAGLLALPTKGRVALAFAGLALGAAILLGRASPGTAAPSSGIVVNEVYGGGGNSGATYTSDFIELRNRGTAAVSLDGWSVQYHSAARPGPGRSRSSAARSRRARSTWSPRPQGAGGTQPLPTAQATGTIAMSGTSGTVAVVNGTARTDLRDSAACQAASVDLVGYGTAVINETAPATGASNTDSVQRKDAADSDNNAADFASGAPTPGATNVGGDGGGTGDGEPGPLRIHDIQDSSWLAAHNGEQVTNVPGIVTGDPHRPAAAAATGSRTPIPDSNPATSEGIFVFTSSPGVAVGDSVLVSGTVRDFYPLSSGDSVATTSNLSVTEIGNPTVIVRSHGNALPAPEVIVPGTVPDAYAPDLDGANIESTPITPSRSALDFWESREGMRVEVDDARVVGPSNDFGEQYVTTKPAQAPTYRGGTELLGRERRSPPAASRSCRRTARNPGVDVGDVFSGATVGPVDYSQFGGYMIAATTVGTVSTTTWRASSPPRRAARQLAVATYNVENLAPGDPASKYQRLAQGVVTNLSKPDVVAVEEVQDNTGATDDGIVAADQTLTKLTDAIVAAGGPRYQLARDRPGRRQGRRPARRQHPRGLPVQPVAGLVRRSRARRRSTARRPGTAVVKSHGDPALTLSPGRIDPANPVWTTSRKPLGGRVRVPRPARCSSSPTTSTRRAATRTPTGASSSRRSPRRCSAPVRPRSSTTSSGRSSTSTARPTSWCSATSTTSSSARRWRRCGPARRTARGPRS